MVPKPQVHIFNIQRFSINDGPGIRTVLFFKGCPLDCAWCHNPESKETKPELFYDTSKCAFCGRCAAVCPQKVHTFSDGRHLLERARCTGCGKCADACDFAALELAGKGYTVDGLMEEIKKDLDFYSAEGGVTFSGGEPFMQPEALYALLKRCRAEGISTCIETSGQARSEDLRRCAPYTDLFLYDIKETDPENHRRFIGAENGRILQNLQLLDALGARVILRCPLIPGVNDRTDHFEALAALAEGHPCVEGLELMPYHPLGIAKAERLGKRLTHRDPRFFTKEQAEPYATLLRKRTRKNVRFG